MSMEIIDLFPEHGEVIDSDSVAAKGCLDAGVSESIKTRKPNCADDKKPYLGQVFSNLDVAFQFYKEYGHACGFDVRRSTQKMDIKGNVTFIYFVCSGRAEFYEGSVPQITVTDSEASKKCCCRAKIILKKFGMKGFAIMTFNEEHNHNLAADKAKQFLSSNGSLSVGHKKFIVDAAKSNIGPTMAHDIFKAMVGSYSNSMGRGTNEIGLFDIPVVEEELDMEGILEDGWGGSNEVVTTGGSIMYVSVPGVGNTEGGLDIQDVLFEDVWEEDEELFEVFQ